jgi:hypothetical protein
VSGEQTEQETTTKAVNRKKTNGSNEVSERSTEVEKTEWDEFLERLAKLKKSFGERPIRPFKTWAPRVARYSFQSGRVLYYKQS